MDGIEEAVSELFAGLGLIYQKMEKERAKNETCLRLNKIDKRRKLHDRPSQRPINFTPKKVKFRQEMNLKLEARKSDIEIDISSNFRSAFS